MNPTTPVASNSGRRSAAGFRRLVAIAAAAALAAFLPSGARAQVAQAWSNDTPLDPYTLWKGARVLAMGDLSVAVEDDRNPFNPYGYSGNPAGLLTARDTSWAEQSSHYRDYFDRYYAKYNSVLTRTSSARFGWLVGSKWALAGDISYATMHASRHDQGTAADGSRFIRDFDVSLPDYFIPRSGDRTIGAGVDYPSAALTYSRRFRSWFTLGGHFGFRDEREDRTVLNDPYDFDNHASATEIGGGVLLHPAFFRERIRLGFYASWTGDDVKGISSSTLNEDSYDLSRPLVSYGTQLEVRRAWLHGIVEGHHHSYDGEQIARVNWAPQFFLNPNLSQVDPRFVFKKKWSSGLVGLRHNQVKTRWMADVPNTPVHVGARWAYYREYEWDRPLPGVLSPMLPIDVRRLGYDGAGGVSFDLPAQEGTVALEVQLSREQRADWTQERDPFAPPPSVPDVTIGQVSYHFGAEYKARPWLPIRAGVALRRYDPDRRDGNPPIRGIRLSAGASYRLNSLGVVVDGAWSHEHFRYTPLDPSIEIGKSDQVALSLQRLF
jgi:hypothetical protein